jgi:hypothetical protein
MLQRLRGKPFYYWDSVSHKQKGKTHNGDCCFNDIIGLPTKLNSYPSYNQSKIKPDNVLFPFKEKHLWIKKVTGLGVTELMLRFMAWLCVRNDDYRSAQMVIVTGPNQELAIKLIKRMKGLFGDKLGVTFDSKETVLELNGCVIEAYPSNHIDAFRSLTNPE